MEVKKERIAYPYVKYKVNVTHSTERKSTAMEWMLLEIAQKVKDYPDYANISLEEVLNSVFSIVDGDSVLRQVLMNLQDGGALARIPGFSDTSDWAQLVCGHLKLTENGERLQKEGKLPARPVTNVWSFVYDVVQNCLVDPDKGLSDTTTSFKAKEIDADHLPGFPESLIGLKIEAWQNGGKNAPPWLQKNSHIDHIVPESAPTVQWKTVGRDITVDAGGVLGVAGESDPDIVEAILENADLGKMPEGELPEISVDVLSKKQHVARYEKIGDVIANYAGKANLFALNPCFADMVKGKRNTICLLLGQDSFRLEEQGDSAIVYLPEAAPLGFVYQDRERSVFAGKVLGHFRDFNRPIPYLYEEASDFSDFLLSVVRKYYRKDRRMTALLPSIPGVSYAEFYTPDDLKDLLSEETLSVYTPVDKKLAKLLTNISDMKKVLGDLSLPVSDETVRYALAHQEAKELQSIYDWIGQWKETLESLKTDTNLDLQEMNFDGTAFGLAMECMAQVAKELSFFYHDASIRYSKVYVFDTCALMNCPEILDDFTDNRALAIIPKQVLVELDGNKKNIDETKSGEARAAIRKIEEYRKEPWMELQEDMYPEVVSKSYQESGIPDINILSVAVKYKLKKPIMVTDDKNFQNFAISEGVETISSGELHEKLRASRGKGNRKADTEREE